MRLQPQSIHTNQPKGERKMKLTFTLSKNGLEYPNLSAPEDCGTDIGRWGRRRKKYLKEHRLSYYTVMKTEGTLNEHLREISGQAEAMFEYSVPRFAKALGANEAMKQYDPMLWVQINNNARNIAEENINQIAHRAHITGSVDAEKYKRNVAELCSTTAEILKATRANIERLNNHRDS
jgi:hypothetical protein